MTRPVLPMLPVVRNELSDAYPMAACHEMTEVGLIGFLIPRAYLAEFFKRDESKAPCVYFLLEDPFKGRSNPRASMYAGESASRGGGFQSRFHKDHVGRKSLDVYFVIVRRHRPFNKSEVQYLEGRAIQALEHPQSVFYKANAAAGRHVHIEEHERRRFEFLWMVTLSLLRSAGIPLGLVSAPETTPALPDRRSSSEAMRRAPLAAVPSTRRDMLFYCQRDGASGKLLFQPKLRRCVLLRGAQVSVERGFLYDDDRLARDMAIKERNLRESGSGYQLQGDLEFPHPGQALAFLLGLRASARRYWVNEDGKTLGEVWPQAISRPGRPKLDFFWGTGEVVS